MSRFRCQLQTLKMWPLQLEILGAATLRVKAKVMLPSVKGRVDIIFTFNHDVIARWPAKVSDMMYDVRLLYGNVGYVKPSLASQLLHDYFISSEEVSTIVADVLSQATPEYCHNILARACAELRNAYTS